MPATPQTVALPAFRTDNPLPNGYPWSLMSVDTNYYRDQPRTGVIRAYDFTVSRGVAAPDGYEREVLLVNGVFPGPLIEANWGDTIQVTVRNNISAPAEGVALHWHGFLQTGKPWEDGVPAVTQCPIAPGCDFTYSFEAELYGTSWYHSHYSAQYAGGLFGPMVIHGPSDVAYDVDVGPVMLSDWYHGTYNGLVDELMQPDSSGRLFSDCNLINGQGCVVDDVDGATAGVAAFRFQRGKTHRLRLINAGAEALQRFSIDGHNMTVVANDFVAVEPYETRVVTLGIGQRADVLVKADGTLDAYWMRANISMGCSLATRGDAVAAIYYDDSDGGEGDGGDGGNHGNANATIPLPLPRSMPWDLPDPGTCANDDLALTRPRMRLALPEADRVFSMDVRLFSNATNHTLWAFDGVDYRGNYNSPTLLMSHLGNTSFARQWNVRDTGGARSVRVIVKNYSNAACVPVPPFAVRASPFPCPRADERRPQPPDAPPRLQHVPPPRGRRRRLGRHHRLPRQPGPARRDPAASQWPPRHAV